MRSNAYLFLLLSLFISSCTLVKPLPKPTTPIKDGPATVETIREFRAAWVATVANINWPSKPGISTELQQKEAIRLLDLLDSLHFNTVIFQVRPQADALYQSNLEPWSYFLSGEMGKAPKPYYDPLAFWIEEAHKRGLELHIWLNPYRAQHSSGQLNKQSIIYKMPESVVQLKQGYWWFDPGKQCTQDHGVKVVLDLLKRYDIDGVHFDDYFYPYPAYNGEQDFPDEATYRAYRQQGGGLGLKDWRRENVNQFIRRIYQEIKAQKKYVKLGISPFGIWRPGHPASIQGMDQFNVLYADAKRWLNAGWIDYLSPQLYWPIKQIPQSFPVLLKWWQDENTQNRHLWPGINIGQGRNSNNVDEVLNQIMISRAMLPSSPGTVHWNIGTLLKQEALRTGLLQGPYKEKALVPAITWVDGPQLPAPKADINIAPDQVNIEIKAPQKDPPLNWVLYAQYGKTEVAKILNQRELKQILPRNQNKGAPLTQIRIIAIDRLGKESIAHIIKIQQ